MLTGLGLTIYSVMILLSRIYIFAILLPLLFSFGSFSNSCRSSDCGDLIEFSDKIR